MSRHTIFLVHGMGAHAAEWSAGVRKQIAALWGKFELAKFLPFEEQFDLKELRYDQHFEARRKQWAADAAAVRKALTDGGMGESDIAELADLGDVATKDRFASTHVLDVLLYRFTAVGARCRADLAQQIFDHLATKKKKDSKTFSVIAHSLGTALAHDTLHGLFSQSISGTPPLQQGSRVKVLLMAGNVSRLLQSDAERVYSSKVQPGGLGDPGVCDVYLNARHKWDPFPVIHPFEPLDDWPSPTMRTKKPWCFQELRIDAFGQPNVHDLGHYLENPKVHVPLFRSLVMEELIGDQELNKRVKAYEEATPFGRFETLKDRLEKMRPASVGSWADLIRAAREFAKALQAFRKATPIEQ